MIMMIIAETIRKKINWTNKSLGCRVGCTDITHNLEIRITSAQKIDTSLIIKITI